MFRAQSAGRHWLFWIIAGFVAAATINILPSPLVPLVALIVACLPLIPQTPLTILAALLVLSPLRALIATEASTVFPLDIGQVLLLLYLGVWLAYHSVQGRPILRLSPKPVLLSVLLMCSVFAFSVWRSDAITNWLSEWLKWVVIAIMTWHLSQTARSTWGWLIFAVLLSALANAVVGLYIFLGGSGADHLTVLGRFFRAFGTFGQPNPFGGFMGIALPITIAICLCHLERVVTSIGRGAGIEGRCVLMLAASAFAFALILAALLASWSRGAWLGFAASFAVMLVAWPRRLVKGLTAALVSAAILGAIWSVDLLPSSIVNRLTTAATDLFTISDVRGVEITPSNYAVIERLAHWQAARNMAQDYPAFGVGLGNYAMEYERYHLINWEDPLGHAHNLFLNVLAEAGTVGLIAYIGFWLVIFRLTWTTRRHPDAMARCVAIGLLGCWTYITVHSAFDNLFVNNLFLHIGVLLSVLAILHQQTTGSLEVE
jgi:O-antigen ligase